MAATSPLLPVLRSVAGNGRDGIITMREGDQSVTLHVEHGTLKMVASGGRRGMRIGEVLLKTGKISQRQLDLVLERQQKSNLRFGELLYLVCQITEDDIRQALRAGMLEEIHDLFLWDGAQADFKEGPPPQQLFETDAPQVEHPFPIGPIIDEGTRRRAEWELFRTKLPPKSMALSKAPPSPGKSELPLDDRTLQIIELCDGRRGLEQVVESSPKFRFETLKALVYLVGVGRIQPGGRVVSVATPTEMLKRDALGIALEAAAAPGVSPEAQATPTPAGRPPSQTPATRFGLDSVPEIDWEAEKRSSRGTSGEDRSPTPPTLPAAEVNVYELRPDLTPRADITPPGHLKKEETSRLMARNAAQAIAHRPPPLPPPEPRRRSRLGRYGWFAAGVLFLGAAGAASWEMAARSKYRDLDARARTLPPAEGRQAYEDFAKAWPLTSPAQAARRAAEDLAGGRVDAAAAQALRELFAARVEAASTGPIELEEAACKELLAWAESHAEAFLAGKCRERLRRIAMDRLGAAKAAGEFRAAIARGDVAAARVASAKLRGEFGRSAEAAKAGVAVRIETNPPGGEIEAAGLPIGASPRVIEAAPGAALAVRAALAGFEPATLVVAPPLPETVVVPLFRRAHWTARVSGAVRLAPVVTATAVYLVTADGTMTSLAPADGHALWRLRPASHPWTTSPVAARSAVLVGGQDGSVWAFEVNDGTLLWREPAGEALAGGLALSGSGGTLFAGVADGVAALEVSTGRSLGKAALPAKLAFGPFSNGASDWSAVLEDGSVVSGAPGKIGWTSKLPSLPAAAASSTAGTFAIGKDGVVTLISPAGATAWSQPNPGAAPAGVACTANRGVALLTKRRAACYDLATGNVLWTANLPADASAAPAIGEALAWIACDDGAVRAFDAVSGAARWTWRGGPGRVPPAPGRDGVVVAGENGDVSFVP